MLTDPHYPMIILILIITDYYPTRLPLLFKQHPMAKWEEQAESTN